MTLSNIEIIEEKQPNCSICLNEDESAEEIVVRLPCAHVYHKSCIAAWLTKKNFCPMCRTEFDVDK